MKVTIYTTPWCAYCKAEKAWLDEHNVEYTTIDVEAQPDKAEELFRVSGGGAVPFTVIQVDETKQEKVLGFDQPKLAQILGLST